MTHPKDLKESFIQLERVFQKEQDLYDIVIRLRHKDGRYFHIQDRGMVISWNNDTPVIMSGTHTDVTERVESTNKVAYMHQLTNYIIDHMNSGIAVHDTDLNYIYVSKHYCDQYGVSKDIIGKHHYDVFPDLPQKWRDVHQRALQGDVIRADRDPYPHPDGTVDMTRWECRPWYDEEDNIAGIIVYTEVINEFITIEEELRNSRDLLQQVMDNLPIGIAINSVLPSVQFNYMNDQFPSCYNTTKEALEEGDFWDVVYEDDRFRSRMKKQVLEDIATNDPSKMMWKDVPLTKDGEIQQYVTAYTTPIPEQNLVISTAINTTKQKELELLQQQHIQELFIQKEEIEATLLAIGDAVIATDHNGHVTNINSIATTLTGFTKEDTLGQPFSNFFTIINETTEEQLPCPVTRVIDTKETVHLENNTVLIAKDGTRRIIEDSAAPILNSDGSLLGVILVFRDVTERKHKQQEIEYLSTHDFLTGLYNRRYFAEHLAKNDHKEHYPLGIMMVDVNGLKIINDAYGHDVGDSILTESATVMYNELKHRGRVFRIGGDEFTIVVGNTSSDELEDIKDRLITACQNIKIENIALSLSIGYDIKYDSDDNMSEVYKKAENDMYRYKLIEGRSARNNTIQAIFETLTSKFHSERTHSTRVASLCKQMGIAMELRSDDIKELEMAGMFHDIGKIAVPDRVLYKPSSLSKEEFNIIKSHTKTGYQILHAADEYSKLAEYALYHHEHYDGSGYPEGLSGTNIPLFARIIGITDAFEAMTSDRPYRTALTNEEAIEELIKYKDKQFDPTLVDVFVDLVYPVVVEDNL